jgi:hypothetical protein
VNNQRQPENELKDKEDREGVAREESIRTGNVIAQKRHGTQMSAIQSILKLRTCCPDQSLHSRTVS